MSRDRYVQTLEIVRSARHFQRSVKALLAEAFLAVPEGSTENRITELGSDASRLNSDLEKLEDQLLALVAGDEARRGS